MNPIRIRPPRTIIATTTMMTVVRAGGTVCGPASGVIGVGARVGEGSGEGTEVNFATIVGEGNGVKVAVGRGVAVATGP